MVAIPARPHRQQMSADVPRTSGRAIMAKQKINQVSQASLALLNPAYAMGMDMEHSWSDSSSLSSSSKRSTSKSQSPSPSRRHASQPSTSSASSQGGYIEDPTPELEAFTMEEFSAAALVRRRAAQNDDDEEYVDEWSTNASPCHRKNATMGSFFEDDADNASPKMSSGRKVAFRVRGGSQDATKEMMAARQGGGKAGSNNGAAGSPLARLFGWKRSAKKSNGRSSSASNHDGIFASQPMSAPAHVTTFDRSMPPLSDGASSHAGSLPVTPIGGVVMPLPPGSPNSLMPHRKGGPPPRGILRKQSAPMLRAASEGMPRSPPAQPEEPLIMLPPRSAEAPPSLPSMHFAPLRTKSSDSSLRVGGRQGPPSPLWTPTNVHRSGSTDSQSSFTERRYSTVGRGVARNRSDASLTSSSSSHSLASNSSVKRKLVDANAAASGSTPSPARRKPVNRRFENMPNSPSVIDWQKLSLSPSPQSAPLRVVGNLFSLPTEVSMAQKVANGELDKGRGFEEPMPRSTSKDTNLSIDNGSMSQRAARRRSRSVGAVDAPVFAVPSLTVDAPAQAPAALLPADGFFAPSVSSRSQLAQSNGTTPTQQSVSSFASTSSASRKQPPTTSLSSPRRHKSEFSVDSVSSGSDSGDSEHAAVVMETVQAARRVQLVGTRAKATALSSPSMRASPAMRASPSFSLRSPLLQPHASPAIASPIPTVNVLPPSSPSVQQSPGSSPASQASKVTKAAAPAAPVVTPPAKKPSKLRSPPGSADSSLIADLSEDEIRRRWSRRDSCILALSMAHVSVDSISEQAEQEEVIEEQARPVLADAPAIVPAQATTAPLNIKPRKRSPKATSPSSSSSSVVPSNSSLTSSSSAFDSLFSESLGSLVTNEDALASMGLYDDSTPAPAAATPQLVTFAPSQTSLASSATANSMPSLDSSASGSSSMASSTDNVAVAAATTATAASPSPRAPSVSPRIDGNNCLGVNLLGMTPSDSQTSMATTVRTSILNLGDDHEGMVQEPIIEAPRRYTHRAQLSEDTFEHRDAATTPTSFNSGTFKKSSRKPVSPRVEINISEHGADGATYSPYSAWRSQNAPQGRLSPSGRGPATRSPSPAHSTRTLRAGAGSPAPSSTRSVTPTQETASGAPASAGVNGLGLGLDLGLDAPVPPPRVASPMKVHPAAAYAGMQTGAGGKPYSDPDLSISRAQYHDFHAHSHAHAYAFASPQAQQPAQVAELGVGEWGEQAATGAGAAYYPSAYDDAYSCDYFNGQPAAAAGARAGGSGEWEMGVAL